MFTTHDSGLLTQNDVPPAIARYEPLGSATKLRIDDLLSDPPNESAAFEIVKTFCCIPMVLCPGISALTPPLRGRNYYFDRPADTYHLGQFEAEEFLAEAARQSGLFDSVVLGEDKYDYEVRGSANYTTTGRNHLSGLGILWASPLFYWWAPMTTTRLEWRVHLEVLRRGQTNAILTRTYCKSKVRRFSSKDDSQATQAFLSSHGLLFSEIVRTFIDDLAVALAPYRTGESKIQPEKPTGRQTTGQQDAAPLPRDP